ncbi:O-antigen ligase family protein [Peribacillus frigoritolerans]|uniref:O-antigen ligase family protein n=1 Tax=Peribacillus frigoritolerans TaxID=450367 RepID=UPI0032B41AE8
MLQDISKNKNSTEIKNNFLTILFYLFLSVILMGYSYSQISTLFILSIIIMGIYVFLSDSYKNYLLVIFILPSLGIFVPDGAGFSFATLVLLLCLLKHIISRFNVMRLNKLGVFAVLLMLFYELSHMFLYSFDMMLTTFRWGALFVYASLVIIDQNFKLDFKRITYYLVAGIFLSTICGYIMSLTRPSKISDNPNILSRFEGLGGDPNGFGMIILISILFLINIYNNSSKGKQLHLYIAFTLGMVGLSTFSRSYLITAVIMITIVTISNFFPLKRKGWILRLRFIFIILLVLLLFSDQVSSMLDTTIGRISNASNLDEVTGDRSLLVQLYWDKFINTSIFGILFGDGIIGYLKSYSITNAGIITGPHNTYIELLVSWGMLGTILFLFYLYSMYKSQQSKFSRKKPYFLGYLPVLCMLIYLVSLQSLAKYNTYFYLSMVLMNIFLTEKQSEDE